MLKKLLRNNCHKFTKELLGNICLRLNKVLYKFLSKFNCIFKMVLLLYYFWKKKVMASGNICIWLWVINYLSKLPCSFIYKSSSVLFIPNSGGTQRIYRGSFYFIFLLLNKDNTVSKGWWECLHHMVSLCMLEKILINTGFICINLVWIQGAPVK